MRTVRDLLDLDGRVAAITGAAGGIGSAMAEALGECGARLALIDRDQDRLDALADELSEKGVVTTTACFDLEIAAADDVIDIVYKTSGKLDILVNNAAFVGASNLTGWNAPFAEQSLETWRRALEVNLTAVFGLTQAAAPLLADSGRGAVINISSIYGLVGPDYALYEGQGMNNPAAYNASKGGLIQLTRWLATTMAPHVRVNAIAPGGVERGQPEPFVTRYKARTPLGRMAQREDFKGAIAYLASDASAYVTGTTLPVDGGWMAW